MNREPDFWGLPDSESLNSTDEYEAVEEILDAMGSPLPETIIIAGFSRMKVSMTWSPLEYLLESLDEEYGNPDKATDPTNEMRAAEQRFLAEIERLYVPFMCEEVIQKQINVAAWVKENRPDWLAADPGLLEEKR